MNAQVGKDEIDKFCLHSSSNSNGEYLVEFSFENRQAKFQKREGKLWTYSDQNNSNAQLHYIFMNK